MIGLCRIRIAFRDISGSSRIDNIRQLVAAGLFIRMDHIQNRISDSRPQIIDIHTRLVFLQRGNAYKR